MPAVLLGSEAVAAGIVTPYLLRSKYVAIHPGVYVPRSTALTAADRAKAAFLWSRRRGVVSGRSAAALHGAKWVDPHAPAELIYGNRHRPAGIITYADRIADDEVTVRGDIRVSTPARAALDMACRGRSDAVAAIDALANATHLRISDVELLVQRYPGRRGIKRARGVLGLVDAGAESPRETWLRLLLVRAGFPPPTTQIPVYDGYGEFVARLDMGWEEALVAVEYDGDHHRTSRRQFNRDIARMEALSQLGWTVIRVTAEDNTGGIIHRVGAALARRV